ncbi:hypothetical protein ACUODF_15295, partial [Escherichia coli]
LLVCTKPAVRPPFYVCRRCCLYCAEGLVERHIPVLISNHDTMLTREWYQRAKLHVVKVRRSISSNGGTRKKVDELLALYKPGVVSPAKK